MNILKLVIVGGCGHVGIPLGLAFATKGFNVVLLDKNVENIELLNSGKLPFVEYGAEEILRKHIGINLTATIDSETVKNADVVIFVVGTPVDEHLNPKVRNVLNVIEEYIPLLSDKQLLIMRSTLFPGTIRIIHEHLLRHGVNAKLAFCPERILQGRGIEEIFNLPQIVSGITFAALS